MGASSARRLMARRYRAGACHHPSPSSPVRKGERVARSYAPRARPPGDCPQPSSACQASTTRWSISVRPGRDAARMKLLTATSQTQGQRDNDYDWCVEGELIRFDVVCGRSARNPDDRCGCGRGFAGMSSKRATTTAVIRDLPMDRRDVQVALAASLHAAGYL